MVTAISNGEFVEHAEVHGNYYGTSTKSVHDVAKTGKVCILDIDVQGVQAVKKSNLNPNIIYIAPPSKEVLEERLRGRNTENEEQIKKRMTTAVSEMEWLEKDGNVDFKIVNDDLEESYKKLKSKLSEYYP